MMEGRGSFTMVDAADEAHHLPQRLDKIMAILHDRLASDVEVQDYHFLVDPIDHGQITHDGFPQLDQLKEAFPYDKISVHFNPDTGEMTVSTLAECARLELQYLLINKTRECIAVHPDSLVDHFGLYSGPLESKLPNCLVAVYPLHHDGKEYIPSLTISFTVLGKKNKAAQSTLAHLMARYPGIQTMIRLDLRGLTKDVPANNEQQERRIQRIAELSSVVTWTRDEYGKVVNTSESLSKEDGELRLRFSNSSPSVEAIVKYSDILNGIRIAGMKMAMGGVTARDDPPFYPLQSSMVPFLPFSDRDHRFPACSKMSAAAARAARLLRLGDTATTTTATATELGVREGARVFRPLPYTANQAGVAIPPWSRLLLRLIRKR